MVTEELTEEETLLAEDDLLEEESAAAPTRRSASPRRARVEAATDSEREPGWVTAAAILGALFALYGVLVIYSIAAEQAPSGITGFFAK